MFGKEQPLSCGRWDENISWEFFLSEDAPDQSLCTAVCCITIFQGKIILVKNKRNWECPAGKIDEGENPEQAVRREVREETGGIVINPKIFGYKKLTTKEPVCRPGESGMFYPFPHSYVVFFYAEAASLSDEPLSEDVVEIALADYAEAKTLLAHGAQYENVLEYLRDAKLIDLS